MRIELRLFLIVFLLTSGTTRCIDNTDQSKDIGRAKDDLSKIKEVEKIAPLTEDDFFITKVGTKIKIHLEGNINDVIKDLGKPISESLAKKGASEYWDITEYIYDGLQIRFLKNWPDGSNPIQAIIVSKPIYKTLRGIVVGSNYKDVFMAYGETYFRNNANETWVSYEKIEERGQNDIGYYYVLTFLIENQKVKEIIINPAIP